jgi:hypothetical protein
VPWAGRGRSRRTARCRRARTRRCVLHVAGIERTPTARERQATKSNEAPMAGPHQWSHGYPEGDDLDPRRKPAVARCPHRVGLPAVRNPSRQLTKVASVGPPHRRHRRRANAGGSRFGQTFFSPVIDPVRDVISGSSSVQVSCHGSYPGAPRAHKDIGRTPSLRVRASSNGSSSPHRARTNASRRCVRPDRICHPGARTSCRAP